MTAKEILMYPSAENWKCYGANECEQMICDETTNETVKCDIGNGRATVKIVKICDIRSYVASIFRKPFEKDVIASGAIDVTLNETIPSLRNKIMKLILEQLSPDYSGGIEILNICPDISPYLPMLAQNDFQQLPEHPRIESIYVRMTSIDQTGRNLSTAPLPWTDGSNDGNRVLEEAAEGTSSSRETDGQWRTDIEDPIRILMNMINKNFKGFVKVDQLRDTAKKIAENAYFEWLENCPRHHPGHIVIMGNPGVGKTTGAIALANFLIEASLVPSDTVLEIHRDDLVDKYVGGTEAKTKNVILSARGGVIIFDEVYTLHKPSSSNDTGKEALTTIMKYMTDECSPVFMFLGYKKHMKDFVNMNPGFQRRIRYIVKMEDYSCKDLAEIVVVKLRDTGLKAEAKLKFEHYFQKLPRSYLELHNASVSVRMLDYATENARQRVLALHFKDRRGATLIKQEDFNYAFKRIKKESDDAIGSVPPVAEMYL